MYLIKLIFKMAICPYFKQYAVLFQKGIKNALLATEYSSVQDWYEAMLSDDTACDLVGVIGLRMLTNVNILKLYFLGGVGHLKYTFFNNYNFFYFTLSLKLKKCNSFAVEDRCSSTHS